MSAEVPDTLDAPLQFDRVVPIEAAAIEPLTCAACRSVVTGSYYHSGGQALCATCGEARQRASAPDRSASTLLRALAYGLGASLAGAVAYWAVIEYLDLQIGIVAIAIGYVVGRAVVNATRGRSSRRHRIIAVALTYLAVGLAYAPFAFKGMKEAKSGASAADSTATAVVRPDSARSLASPSASTAPASGAAAHAPAPTATSKKKGNLTGGQFVIGLLALVGIVLALPVIGALGSMPVGLISILIIGLGLRQAWRVSGAANRVIAGPFPVADRVTQ